MVFRLSTLSTVENSGADYNIGDLSLYPNMLDDMTSLYQATNNSETKLKQSLSYNGKFVIVEDASGFPPNGLIRIGRRGKADSFELVYYEKRNDTTFMNLVRGFAGSIQNTWGINETYVSNAVVAEHHNALKDAVLNIQSYLGTKDFPEETSLNGMLKTLEFKHLAPKPVFKAFPQKGPPGTSVRFQNFSNTESIRFIWDFGDGTISDERNPTHVYQSEGIYTVRLNMIMSTGAQGITIKSNYITISDKEVVPFFHATLLSSSTAPATYEFVDQTDGDISARFWVFGDGENIQISNPNQHTIEHTYTESGTYQPSLLVVFRDSSLKRVFLTEAIIVG